MNEQNPTDAQMEAEFHERNKNLKESFNNVVDKIDHATQSTQDFLESPHGGASLNSDDIARNKDSIFGANSTQSNSDMSTTTNRRPSLIREQGFHQTHLDYTLMSNIENDIIAMHSTDPELFEIVASKFDETFGANALV